MGETDFCFVGILGRKLGDVAKESVRFGGRERLVGVDVGTNVAGACGEGEGARVVLGHTSSPSSLQS